MEVEEFLKEAAVMKEIKHPNLVQLLGEGACLNHRFPQRCLSPNPCCPPVLLLYHHGGSCQYKSISINGCYFNQKSLF